MTVFAFVVLSYFLVTGGKDLLIIFFQQFHFEIYYFRDHL